MKFSNFIFWIGLTLWLALGFIIFYLGEMILVVLVWSVTTGVLLILYLSFELQELEKKEVEE